MQSAHLHTASLLEAHAFRKTAGRISLLDELARASRPITADQLERRLATRMDRAALYRALDAFVQAGIVEQYDFGHGHAHYELAGAKPHHHHVICETCGKIEDIPSERETEQMPASLVRAAGFSQIFRHSLELYGTCSPCASVSTP